MQQCEPIHDEDNVFSLSARIEISIVPVPILHFYRGRQLSNLVDSWDKEDRSVFVSSFFIEQFENIKNELEAEKRLTRCMASSGKLWVEQSG